MKRNAREKNKKGKFSSNAQNIQGVVQAERIDKIEQHFYGTGRSAAGELRDEELESKCPKIPLEIPSLYRKWLTDCCRYMDIDNLRDKGRVIQVNLPEIFVPLYTHSPLEKKKGRGGSDDLREQEKAVEIEELLADSGYLLIEGEAGSGKTTLMKHIAYMMLNQQSWKGLDEWLPVLIFLKDIKHRVDGEASVSDFIGNHLSPECVERYCQAGKTIVLLDGLDEIGSELRDKIVTLFSELQYKYGQCKIILSGRPHGISGKVVERFGNRHIKILPLTMGQVEEFIMKWFRNVFDAESQIGERTALDMIGEIKSHPSIDRLIDNPLLLSAICILYHDGKALPGQRAELYKKFTTNLLYRRFSDPENIRYFLMALALEMHTKRARGIDRKDAVRLLGSVYPRQENEREREYKQRLSSVFDDIEPRSGLLKREGGEYNFRHLTFQEFFTAIGLVDKETDYSKAIRDYWSDEWYREVIELYIGYLSIENRSWANRIIREILEEDEKKPFYRWRLAGWSLLDIHPNTREPEVVEWAKKRMISLFDTDVEPKARADAGEILGWLGDPRNLEEFISVNGGSYSLSMGTVTIAPFMISQYPVTNRWYARFVKNEGYENPDYWSEEGRKWLAETGMKAPEFWHDRRWNCPNAPVVGVSWYEAEAFCRWLGITEKEGDVYRLPTEQEWEAAAAGAEKREYAWGHKFDKNKCNSFEAGIGRTSAVGIFKWGETPEGISDLSGNVWEWTSTIIGSDRVLRGGSWDLIADGCRAAFRYWSGPSDRVRSFGFRLCVLPGHSSK
ncbi:MAG: NACHT domain-containing protein [bacterium]